MLLEEGRAGLAGRARVARLLRDRAHMIIGFSRRPSTAATTTSRAGSWSAIPGRAIVRGYTPDQMLGRAKIKSVWGEEL